MSSVNMDDDGDEKDDSKRRTRNLSEKKRRDQFNVLVHELSSMVSTNNRKMDKSTVLKSTISFLKNHNEITARSRAHDVQEDWKPTFLTNEEFTYLVLEALEGFVMVFSVTGKIYYASESVSSLLGHTPVDLANNTIFDITHEDDRPNLYNLLQLNAIETEHAQCSPKVKDVVKFEIHMRRGKLDTNEDTSYELVVFSGHFRACTEQLDQDNDKNYDHDVESRVMFVGTGLVKTPQLIRDVSLVDLNRSEFTSRHSLEWKFLFLDHRAPPIIGYLPFEVLGTSGYDYYHVDDLEKVVTCHEALMQKGELTSGYYRFLTKGQQWIWLQTRFYITYHQWNSKPEFVVCTHRVVSYIDVTSDTKKEAIQSDALASEMDTCVMKECPEESKIESMSPSYVSESNEDYGASYQSHSQAGSSQRVMRDALSDETPMAQMSPTYLSGTSDPFNTSYRPPSQTTSIKTSPPASTAATSWSRSSLLQCDTASDNGSVSGGSRSSGKHNSRHKKRHQVACYDRNAAILQQGQKPGEGALVPQHGIGTQYLDPAPYVSAMGVPAVLPLPLAPIPVIVAQDQTQMQLQRKHEELQQMIVRQQEELRQVKEQLLLARLGMLQPIVNVTYASPEEMQQQGQGGIQQITYHGAARPEMPYPPSHPPQAPHPPHPPQPPGPHHMPQ